MNQGMNEKTQEPGVKAHPYPYLYPELAGPVVADGPAVTSSDEYPAGAFEPAGATARHYSSGKAGVDQLPVEVLVWEAAVFSYGERKYDRDNWKNGNPWHEFYGSLLRHVFDWQMGKDYDDCDGRGDCTYVDRSDWSDELRRWMAINAPFGSGACRRHSGLHHLAHARWNTGALLYFQMHSLGTDDRQLEARP